LLARNSSALASFGYRLVPHVDLWRNRTFYDLYRREQEQPLLPDLSRIWPISVSASGSDFVLAVENGPSAVPLLVRKDRVEEWDTEASMRLPPVYVSLRTPPAVRSGWSSQVSTVRCY
jgi:hypothetical protein